MDALALESEQAVHDGGKALSPRSPRLPKEKVKGANEEEDDDTHVATNVFDTEEEVETRKVRPLCVNPVNIFDTFLVRTQPYNEL